MTKIYQKWHVFFAPPRQTTSLPLSNGLKTAVFLKRNLNKNKHEKHYETRKKKQKKAVRRFANAKHTHHRRNIQFNSPQNRVGVFSDQTLRLINLIKIQSRKGKVFFLRGERFQNMLRIPRTQMVPCRHALRIRWLCVPNSVAPTVLHFNFLKTHMLALSFSLTPSSLSAFPGTFFLVFFRTWMDGCIDGCIDGCFFVVFLLCSGNFHFWICWWCCLIVLSGSFIWMLVVKASSQLWFSSENILPAHMFWANPILAKVTPVLFFIFLYFLGLVMLFRLRSVKLNLWTLKSNSVTRQCLYI